MAELEGVAPLRERAQGKDAGSYIVSDAENATLDGETFYNRCSLYTKTDENIEQCLDHYVWP